MFKFFKDKLKQAIDIFSKKVDEESKPVEEPEEPEEIKEKPKEIKEPEAKKAPVKEIKEIPEEKVKKPIPAKPISAPVKPIPVKPSPAPVKPTPVKPSPAPVKPTPVKPSVPIQPSAQVSVSAQELLDGITDEEVAPLEKAESKEEIDAEEEKRPEPEKKAEPELEEEIEPEEEAEAEEEKLKAKAELEAAAEETKLEEEAETEFEEEAEAEEEELEAKTELEAAEEETILEEEAETEFEEEAEAEEEVEPEPEKEAVSEEKKGFFSRLKDAVTDTVTKSTLSDSKFEEIFWELEMVLLENNVAVEVIEKIKSDLKKRLVDTKVRRGAVSEIIIESLRSSIDSVLDVPQIDLMSRIKKKKPYIIVFFGINGSGKTTTIAKLAHFLKKRKLTAVIAASDTFRAAAIQQLEEHANKLNIKMIKHDYGSDPAAVAFDAINYAKTKDIDVVLIDTAGRLHTNTNLMNEMEKITRVAKPDLKLFIGESITGNDCVEQARQFNEIVGIDGIILSKADIDEKGGASVSVSYITKKPILFVGTGQNYDDLEEFKKENVLKNLGLD